MIRFLAAFSAVAVGLGAARALTTTYVPVLLKDIEDNPGLIGAVMMVNALAGFAVPLAAGWWSDRRGTRAPFILGGALLAGGGLVAIALGTTSSYLALALAALTVYVGLNAAQTAHRAVVAERFEDAHRPRATGAQEVAMLLGVLVGTVGGGVLVDASPELLFVAGAVVVSLLALPTLGLRVVRARSGAGAQPPTAAAPAVHPLRTFGRDLLRATRTPGAREVLAAQVLWVFAYVALAPFMVLYADEVLDLGSASAGLLVAAFGLLTGAGMLGAGALPPRLVRPALLAGTLALGLGLLLALPASSVAVAAAPFALAAVGAGVVTALGFPYFARFIPEGEAGAYSGVFFSGRAIAGAAALPSAGGLVALTGSYRALLGMGAAAVVAAIPLGRAERRERQPRLAPLPHRSALRGVVRTWAPRLSISVLAIIAIGLALPGLQGTDERLFREINGLGHGPEWVYQALDPHSRNYALLVLLAALVGLTMRRGRFVFGAALTLVFAAFASDAILEIGQILFDRPRPEEAIGAGASLIEGRTWSHIPSYPSGHLMVTAAMVAALVKIAPRLKWPLVGYLLAVAVTRITFGAHFPLDVVVGGIVGWEVGVFSVDLVRAGGLLPGRAPAPEPLVAPAPAPQPDGARS
ncbi:MAG TPA: MFS transporter [Solirubrobacteraceae bacterium]|nr:MFS transporter [Solirubrobacteraceae bacterium]